jgi:hypothetical protein
MTDPELAVPTEIIDALPVHQEGAQETAKQAKEWLITKRQQRGYRAVDRNERVKVVQAFAAHNKVVYGQAFDLVRISAGADPKFFDLDDLTAAVARKEIILIEVKAQGSNALVAGSSVGTSSRYQQPSFSLRKA